MVDKSDPLNYSGFCIDVFKEVVKFLEENYYPFPFELVTFNGTYNELVFQCYGSEL